MAGQAVQDVRRFNRFYTKQIGLLNDRLYGSTLSLTETRVLYELAHQKQPTATILRTELGLDAGYLSRILQFFEEQGLIRRTTSKSDARRSLISLTPRGRKVFAPLDTRANSEVAAMLSRLSRASQKRLLQAMRVIRQELGNRDPDPTYVLRGPKPGDIGWIVHRHGWFYAERHGYDARYEALVARIASRFIEQHDPRRERCWIAERGGDLAGCVFLVAKSKTVAQLRLLFVEPASRGIGLGTHLVRECVRFARQAGYRKVTLWTQGDLDVARHIYKKAGFRLVQSKRHRSWGPVLTGETWELPLGGPPR